MHATAICQRAADPSLSLILAIASKLLLERRQLCEWRIRIGRAVTLARRRARGIGPVRAAIAVVLAAIARALVEFAFAASLVAILIPVLALETLAWRAARVLIVSRRTCLCTIGAARRCCRRVTLRTAMFVAAPVTPMALALNLALTACGHLAFDRRCSGFVRSLVTAAIMARAAFIRSPAGTPDFHQFRGRGRGLNHGLACNSFGRRNLGGDVVSRGGFDDAFCGSLDRCRQDP